MRRLVISGILIVLCASISHAHIEVPYTLGKVIADSTHISVMTVTKVDRQNNQIIYQKVRDLKGNNPQQQIKHAIRGELVPGEIKAVMEWAEVGKTAIFFHNGSASETCTGMNWYQAYPQGEWWGMSHGEGGLLRSFAGNIDKLAAAVSEMIAGREVLVPCFANGDRKEWVNRRGKLQRVRASMKLLDYNEKRDFAGWGGEDIRALAGMPGFTHFAALGRVDAEGQAISCADIDNDGRIDLCLTSTTRVMLLQNMGESFNEVALPGLIGGSRSSVFADYNGDGLSDLLLATARGPKLYTNLGKGAFRDDTPLLPVEPCYDLTGAVWLDADGDGKLDILLANGFHGLRLYLNKLPADANTKLAPPKLSDWQYIGPFDNVGNKGFATVYPPENEIDLKKKYPGRGGEIGWQPGKFTDGAVNGLAIFSKEHNENSVVYLHREIQASAQTELPASLGSDDTLTVWLNGEKIISDPSQRAAAPDQNKPVLKLKPGKNTLLLKICQGGGDWGFYFAVGQPTMNYSGWFQDATQTWGLGADSSHASAKGGSLATNDVNGDGKPDFFFSAGQGSLFINRGNRFEVRENCGVSLPSSKAGVWFADINNDGHIDALTAHSGGVKFYRGDGTGAFVDVTEQNGDLAKPIIGVTSAAWGDFNNDGRLDLMIGCMRGPTRYLEANTDGTFSDKTDAVGLTQKLFNSQALALADLNNDGKLDLILNNEGQDSAILFGNKELKGDSVPVVVEQASVGTRLRILKDGKLLVAHQIGGGEGRGGQASLSPRFTLSPGTYKLEYRLSEGQLSEREINVADRPLRVAVLSK